MLISITGTPGTGKTRVATTLAKLLNANLISIAELIKRKEIPYTYDPKRRTKAVKPSDIQRAVSKHIDKKKTNIIEGHLSHLIKTNLIFVLRCDPAILKRRLRTRWWPKSKVNENVLCEILDSIAIEARQNKGAKIYEIDTTHRPASTTASQIARIIKKPETYVYKPVNWLERYKKWL